MKLKVGLKKILPPERSGKTFQMIGRVRIAVQPKQISRWLKSAEMKVVIVGTGVAGASAAIALRNEGHRGPITLIGSDPEDPYRRPPLSKDFLGGTMPVERTRLKPPTIWAEKEIELIKGANAESIDVGGKTIHLDSGQVLQYDQLLLATGGRPKVLKSEFMDMTHVYTLRHLRDVAPLRNELNAGSHLVVVGAGLIGSEVAATAKGLGVKVTILEAASAPIARLMPAWLGEKVASLHKDMGVKMVMNARIESFNQYEGGVRISMASGNRIDANAVLVAIGMTPNIELAANAEIEVADGIVVDAYGRTSQDSVWAAGDVANMENGFLGGRYRIEHWTNAQDHGVAVAKNILGQNAPYNPVPWCWSDQYGVSLQICGWPDASDDVGVRGDINSNSFLTFFHRKGRLVGSIAFSKPKELRAIRELIGKSPFISPELLSDPKVDLAELAKSQIEAEQFENKRNETAAIKDLVRER